MRKRIGLLVSTSLFVVVFSCINEPEDVTEYKCIIRTMTIDGLGFVRTDTTSECCCEMCADMEVGASDTTTTYISLPGVTEETTISIRSRLNEPADISLCIPQNAVVAAETTYVGDSVEFHVDAAGTEHTVNTYQWERDGRAISGATQSRYVIDSATLQDNGASFACLVTNSYGEIKSNAATLTVLTGPKFTTLEPDSQHVLEIGDSLTISFVASGATPMSFEWYRNDTLLTETITPTYIISQFDEGDAGRYYCVAANQFGTDTSAEIAVISASQVIDETIQNATLYFVVNGKMDNKFIIEDSTDSISIELHGANGEGHYLLSTNCQEDASDSGFYLNSATAFHLCVSTSLADTESVLMTRMELDSFKGALAIEWNPSSTTRGNSVLELSTSDTLHSKIEYRIDWQTIDHETSYDTLLLTIQVQ